MLKHAHDEGVQAALQQFGVKTALLPSWDPAAKWPTHVSRAIFGHPDILLRDGWKAFKDPTSGFHVNNVLWPQGNAPGKWMGRAGTILSALPMASALMGGGDPNEGRLTNLLSAAGGALGGAYGFPALGLLGGGMISGAGARIGKGIGHLLGSRPRHRPMPPPPAPEPVPNLSGNYLTPGGF